MATATTRIERRPPSPAEEQAAALGQILHALTANKEAILASIEIMGQLHQAGILPILQGMLHSRQEIGVIGLTQLNKSGAQNFIKNAMTAVQFMGSLDPAHLKEVLGAVAHGLEEAKVSEERVGIWSVFSTVRDPDVLTSVSLMLNFLRGMGEALPTESNQNQM